MARAAVALAGVALLGAAGLRAADIPTGVISDAAHANVDGVDAALGANVYAGDALSTLAGGTLRMRVGAGQLFMLASTDASITQDHALIDMIVKSGTAGLSATMDDPLEIDTPVGTVRPANTQHAFGQITVTGAHQITITAYEGTLLLENNGERHLIEAGHAYRVTLAPDPAPAGPPQNGQGVGTGNHRKLIFDLILMGGAVAGGFGIWELLCESPSAPKQ